MFELALRFREASLKHQHKTTKEIYGIAKGKWKFIKHFYKNFSKRNTYEMEVRDARIVVNHYDYYVYHFPRPALPLCLGNPILVCCKAGYD